MKKNAKNIRVGTNIDREMDDDFLDAMGKDAKKRGDKYLKDGLTDYNVSQSVVIRRLIRAYIQEHK